jgi:putative membrane protein
MVIYDTKKWGDTFLKILVSFRKANNYKRLLKFILISVVYSGLVTTINLELIHYKPKLDPVFFSLVGLILSLILVFRLNTSYNKWWEGSQQWGMLVNNSRTLSSYLHSIIDVKDKATRSYMAAQITNFSYSLKGHLRDQMDYHDFQETSPDYIEDLKKYGHLPHKISALLFAKIQELYKNQEISDIDKLIIKPQIENMIDILGACERIRNTPIPFSHSSFIKVSLVIYILILPFGLINSFMYLTIPVTALMTYALVGVEIISEEIEEPFNVDPNDLPLTYLCGIIKKNVYHVLEVELPNNELVNDTIEYANYKIHF